MCSIIEKDGIKPFSPLRMSLFRDFMNSASLMDLDLKGNKYTFSSNPRDGIVTYQKIDRVLVNWGWRFLYQHATGIALPILNSDHSPIVLLPYPPVVCPKFFRYKSFWEDHEDCRKVVSEGWLTYPSRGGRISSKQNPEVVKDLSNHGVMPLLRMQQLRFLS